MNILITGANGFVGCAVAKHLLAHGHAVRGAVRRNALQGQLPGVEQVAVGELAPDTFWEQALHGMDTVIHLAARVHLMNDTVADPLAVFRLVNVEGTRQLALEAAKAGVKRLVFVSSVKVHGEEAPTPYDENSSCNPQDPYGVSKMEAEQALRRIEAETGLEVVIVRPPLVYGPGVKANFLRMVQVIARGLPLPLASIANRRSLLYVGNLANALATCVIHPKAAGQTYLVSDGKAVSTPELIRSVAAVMGVPARLFPMPVAVMQLAGILTGKKTAVQRLAGSLAVDSSKIRQELGWVPPFTMEEGLKETAEWFKKHQS
jgi:nucleoside-diphosphate-sugar epimerase